MSQPPSESEQLLLVAGFGMLARLGHAASAPWVLGKIVVWVVFGALVAVPFRVPRLARPLWLLLPALGFPAGYLALHEPGGLVVLIEAACSGRFDS